MTAKVVVIGGSFAGLALALRLPRKLRVVVIDPRRHFEFLPNIHELLSGHKQSAALLLDRARLLERAGHRFVQDRVADLDLERRRAVSAGGQRHGWDVLVVATGSAASTHGVPGADAHAMLFRTVEDCAAIGQRLRQLSAAAGSTHPVVIVGGGLEGIEALGEVLRRYRDARCFEIILVESSRRLLPEGPPGVDPEVRKRCAGLPVRFITGARVARVGEDRVWLADGQELSSRVTIWTGGIAPPSALARWGLAPPGQWAEVEPTLQSRLNRRVFVVGDAAAFPGSPAKQAYHALDMGEHAADNLQRLLRGRRLRAFHPSSKPMLVSFGDLDTYLISGGTALAGAGLAPLKEAVYQLVMARLDRPTRGGAAASLLKRAGRGLREQVAGVLGSADRLRRSLDLRVIR